MLSRYSPASLDCRNEYRKGALSPGVAVAVAALCAGAAPAAAQTYVGNSFSSGSSLLALQTDGNADKYPPFVILQEYGPSGPATTGATFGSAGTVNDVSFYGGGNYDFTVYALESDGSPAPNEQKFTVVGYQTFNNTTTTTGVQNLAANFPVGKNDYLAFAGIGPWYPQAPNNATGSDATYASSSEPAHYPTSFTAIAPTSNQTFTVGAHGDTNANYEIVPNSFENQGRSYAIGVDYTPNNGAGGTTTHSSNIFTLSANTPITFSGPNPNAEGATLTGQCSACVQGEFGQLNKPLGVSISGFGLGPSSPPTPVQVGGKTLYTQSFEGDLSFSLLNPDGTNLVIPGGRIPEFSIEGATGNPDVMIEFEIPAPVTINDDTNDLQLGAGFTVSGNLYVAIFGQVAAGQQIQIEDVGPAGINCATNPTFCSEAFLGFTMDATIEASTSPISFSSAFPSTVPEPSTWAMLILGFAGLGYAGWRRSGCVAAA